jgi:uncharacterized repeat protein (TIGR03806 family)
MQIRIFKWSLALSLSIVFLVLSCQKQADKPATNKRFVFHEKLSAYNFFEGDMADLKPVEDVLPYELNTPLFSDYAHKARFIKLPAGEMMNYQAGELDFPEGTILIKNFFYYHDDNKAEAGRRLIETRLLVKDQEKWIVGNYEWNEAQTEAERNILGGKKPVSWIDKEGITQKINYVIPDNNDCKSCHKKEGYVMPIGPKPQNLNKDIIIAGNPINQLQHWQQQKALSNLEDFSDIPQLPQWDNPESGSLDHRAKAYLDVNCAHCHSRKGPASNTGLFLSYGESDPHRLGVFKGPVSAAQGSGQLKYNIVPGDASNSIMHYRMNSTETGIAMPELGKTIVHDEGVALIAEWINGMSR